MAPSPLVLTAPPSECPVRPRKRRDPAPRFKQDLISQLDPISGCPALAVPPDHLAWQVRTQIAELDLSALESTYSSLGRRGFPPRNVLAVLVYGSFIGLHHSTKLAKALQTDIALRLVAGGHPISAGKLRCFRRENLPLFMHAIEQTIALAHQRGLLKTDELAVDSMRLRAHASLKEVRTLERSTKRLTELAAVDVTSLDADARAKHDAKVLKHSSAIDQCRARARASIVTTNESAALMKFPSGAALPGHRITVTSAGVKERFVVGVLVDSAPTDYTKLGPALDQARQMLTEAGVGAHVHLQAAADAGYAALPDYAFAAENRDWVDVLIPVEKDAAETRRRNHGLFGRERFTVEGDRATCPAGVVMAGPYANGDDGRTRWFGVGCSECALKPQCTKAQKRALLINGPLENARDAMRARMAQPGAKARYNKRLATIEPVFSNIEDTMGFRRASSRHAASVVAEVMLKILAHNLSRLATARRLALLLCFFEPEF